MGWLGKVIGVKVSNLRQDGPPSRPVVGEYISARDLDASRPYPTPYGDSPIERCIRFCSENPKLATLGGAALAIALASLAKRRRIL
jgi:hypothetical protein